MQIEVHVVCITGVRGKGKSTWVKVKGVRVEGMTRNGSGGESIIFPLVLLTMLINYMYLEKSKLHNYTVKEYCKKYYLVKN